MSAIAIVPARGGSKGIPRKNLAAIGGEPLVARAVRIARDARLLDRVVVSTDDDEIAAVAAAAGAEVVRRPEELAGDDAPTEAALLHALDVLAVDPTWTVTLEPTSPLRTAALIDRCVEHAETTGAGAVITVAPTLAVLGRLEAGVFAPLDPRAPRRRQLRTPLYRESSTVYVTRTAHLRSARSVLADPLYAVAVTEEEAIDVNEELDLRIANAVLDAREGRS